MWFEGKGYFCGSRDGRDAGYGILALTRSFGFAPIVVVSTNFIYHGGIFGTIKYMR